MKTLSNIFTFKAIALTIIFSLCAFIVYSVLFTTVHYSF